MPDFRSVSQRYLHTALCATACALWLVAPSSVAASLPDGRVYEHVSPSDKNGADILSSSGRARASVSGQAFQFSSLTGFGDVGGMGVGADYIAVRSATGGWKTHSLMPPQGPASLLDIAFSGLDPRYMGEFSDDLSRGVLVTNTPLTNAPNVTTALNLYRRTDLLSSGAGTYELLTDATTFQAWSPTGDPFATLPRPFVAGTSATFSHVAFESPRNLTADAVAADLDTGQPKLYVWANGVLRLAGILPASEGGNPTVSKAGMGASADIYTPRVVSQDGRRVSFTAPPFSDGGRSGTLYLRDDQGTATTLDDTTFHVNTSERTDCNDDPFCGGDDTPDPMPDVQQSARYWTASADGAMVFFTTAEQLTDDDINTVADLYRFDAEAPEGSHLTRLSIDQEPADNGGDLHFGHSVSGVLGASTHGDYVYFTVTLGQLVEGGRTGETGSPTGGERIFVWHNGEIRQVGAVSGGIEFSRILGLNGYAFPKISRVTPDGTHLAFATQGSDELLQLYGKPGYDHGATCPEFTALECDEIYVYDATANGGAGDLQCASCSPTGEPATTDANLSGDNGHTTGGGSRLTSRLSRALSDDGHFVFFNTDEQLVPTDRNSTTDVYEFDTSTGQLHLLSSGVGGQPSWFVDASPDGHDVFFTTRDRLSPTDVDDNRDLYDARVGGTSGLPAPTFVPCTGEGCKPPAGDSSIPAGPASVEAEGPEDVLRSADPPALFAVRLLGPKHRRLLSKGQPVGLLIAASRPGSIVVQFTAKIDGRKRVIQRIQKRLRRPGKLRVALRLSRAARQELAEEGRLRLRVATTYSQAPNAQVQRLMLRSPNA